jgi:hypothetical protein
MSADQDCPQCSGTARPPLSRREALTRISSGFGMLALAGLMSKSSYAGPAATRTRPPHFKPRATNVIFCYMSGGVSHVDTFDPKPKLAELAGKPMPVQVQRTQFNNNGTVMPSQWEFKNRGKSGLAVSELFPNIAKCADDLCVIRSMTSKFSEHAQGNLFMHTGFPFIGFPSAGAWTSYGLGTESENLPGYVVLRSGDAAFPHGGVGVFGSGFLPAVHEASIIGADKPEPLANVRAREAAELQRKKLDFVGALDRNFTKTQGADAHVEAAIQNYELAWRMQSSVPELCDISGETDVTKKMYGLDDPEPKKAAYARQCLTARRLVERGVRFVELSCLSYGIGGGNAANPWDNHGEVKNGHGKVGNQVDQPIAALLSDLKSRGLLDTTLVIWAGEFGRTPFSQGGNGRDHNPYGFSVWLAGGGVKGGFAYGATDELGYYAVENQCTVYDLWATVLHLLGLNHENLTYRYSGRDVRLTDVHGHVLHDIMR